MVTYGVTRFGQDKATGSAQALFLKRFSGEVLLAFERQTVTAGRVFTRQIDSGRSAQFPLVGAAKAGFHVPGDNLITDGGATPTYLSQPKTSEKVISIDGIMQSSAMIADIDEAMNHWSVRRPFSREMGWALANEMDVRTLMTIVFGSTVSATLSGDNSSWGSVQTRQVIEANFASSEAGALSGIEQIALRMNKDDVPESGRHIAVKPETYQFLAKSSVLSSKDYNQTTQADIGKNRILMYQGIHIHQTNRIADGYAPPTGEEIDLVGKGAYSSTSDATGEEHGTDYWPETYTNVVGVAWQEDRSVGVVRLLNMSMQMQYKLEYLSTLLVAGYAVGHGVLHEAACYSVVTS